MSLRKSQQSDSVFFSPVSLLLSTPHAAEPFHFNHKGKTQWGWGEYLGVYYHIHINMLILSFLKKTTLDVITLQTTLYSTCVTGPRTLDTNRAMLVYHNMYAETFLLSYYPCNVRRLLIKAFKFTHGGRISAFLPLSQPVLRAIQNESHAWVSGEMPTACQVGRNWKRSSKSLPAVLTFPPFESTSTR